MKKIFGILGLAAISSLQAQFKIAVEVPGDFAPREVYLYTLNGSKDILSTKEMRKGNLWQIAYPKFYQGMMKLYFPENGTSLNFISENKDVKLKFETKKNKISKVEYLDESNALMNNLQDIQQKKEYILPALYQIKEYYKEGQSFGKSLDEEIQRLSADNGDLSKFPFVQYYSTNYSRFVEKSATKKPLTHEEIVHFLVNSDEKLESSSLLRPILVAYLNIGPNTNITNDVDKLLAAVNTETPRGQTILSELIELFDAYDMQDLKTKYLTEAKNLKCTINQRLSGTISANVNTEVGAKFPDYKFNHATNSTAKSIYDLKAEKKIIVFWSSTCSHCEAELPKIIEKYNQIKAQKAEVIAFSLDVEKEAYENKVKNLPWVNDSELRGWYSSFVDAYNVHATPTYFVLDSNNKIIAKPDHVADLLKFLNLN
ncbi:peroxiredoxin [Chryseobacterium koreense]|uniref:peroxiredoxin family protein n=1 Tax=Chryseobacterium koreense TaxID=232216 RepID=UPI0026EAA24B|nr:TlpA disulfide reductase family protein [Chryseobacterium koreense]